MFEIGSCSKTGKDLSFTHEINVLVVIHDMEYLVAPGNLLESCSYKVTKAGNAVAALSFLSDRKFDLVLVDIGLIDFDAFKLIKIIARMNQQAMLLSPYDHDALQLKALDSGATMLVKRPLQADVLKHIRQIVLRRQRVLMSNKYDEGKDIDCEIIGDSGFQSKGKAPVATTANNGIQIMDEGENQNGFLPRKEKQYRKRSNRLQECDPKPADNNDDTSTRMRNSPIIWTKELHDKFMKAVDHLGEGGCYPREILKHMSVNGLSRWQVASHLQKCRNNDWRPPGERKSSSSVSYTDLKYVEEGSQSNHPSEPRHRRKLSGPREHPKRFGRYPAIGLKAGSAVHKCSQSISNTNKGAGANGNANDNYTKLERAKLLDYDQIFSDLGSDFSENGRRENDQTVENHEKQTFYQQGPGINEGSQTTETNNNIDIADYDISNDNFSNIWERTEPADQDYDPIFSDLGELSMPKSYHSSILTDDQKQTHDDFHDFLPGMEVFYPNMIENRLPDEFVLNRNSFSQYSLFGFNNISPHDQHPSEPNGDKNGEWAGASTSHFHYKS